MKKLIAFLAVLAVGITFATAADEAKKEGKKHDPAETFKKLDKDGDGFLTLEEFSANSKKDPAKLAETFKKKDKNGDGKLSLEEFMAGHKPKADAAPAPAAPAATDTKADAPKADAKPDATK